MAGLYKQFSTDTERERDGILVEYGEFRVTIARAGGSNKSYGKALENKTRSLRRVIATGLMDAETSRNILIDVYAEQVVRNWETKVGEEWKQGIEDAHGDLIPFTADNVAKTLKALPDLFLDIKEQAENLTLFRASLREDLGKA
jgi:hypothetical protein